VSIAHVADEATDTRCVVDEDAGMAFDGLADGDHGYAAIAGQNLPSALGRGVVIENCRARTRPSNTAFEGRLYSRLF